MKILLAVHASDYSNVGVDAVAERPWPEGSVVQIISAIELPYVPAPETWTLPNSTYSHLEQATEEQAESAVREARHRLQAGRAMPLDTITKTRIGRAVDVILNEAEKWGADLIVLGSHGYRGLRRFLLGSVSQAVSTHAARSRSCGAARRNKDKEGSAMISELNDQETYELLQRGGLGRLGCCDNGQPYVVPINYRFDGLDIYIHSLPGRKIDILRANPRACLQVDEIADSFHWRSVIVFGQYEEITDEMMSGRVLVELFTHLPELSPVESRMRPGSPPVIVFRLRIEEITGLSEQSPASLSPQVS